MSTMRGPKIPIGKLLLDQGKISQEQLKQALAMQQNSTEKLGRLLVDLGFVNERDILAAYAQQLNIPVYDAGKISVDSSVAKVIPDNLVQRYNVVPIRRNGGKLQVAMQDPTNVFVLDDLRLITGFDIEPILATSDDILAIRRGGGAAEPAAAKASAAAAAPSMEQAMASAPTSVATMPTAKSDSPDSSMSDLAGMLDAIRRPDSPDSGRGNDEDGAEGANDAPIIRMVNVLIQTAVKEKASDIHVEPERKNVRVRYRIDGVLYEMMTLPKFVHAPLTSRLKIMSDMNIAERRIPQDGRIHIRHEGHDYDMRVNTLPTVFGEKVVMRILDQGSVLIGLGKLGFTPDMMAELEELVIQPNGMVLVTGPTGSGKTTTLYSILNKINSVEKNILTIEDPVEYQLPSINQVTVNRKAGLTFPVAMRAFLRQDPDIIMVGEIRDLETAEIAVQASLTGHMVLSTLHTNDSPSTIVRLSDMGVEPFLISASIMGVIAQRLGRKLCDQCKEPIDPPVDALLRLGVKEEELQGGDLLQTGWVRQLYAPWLPRTSWYL
ncbi:MAG TPA: ATPase, T2SS/T4P/T4SS family [Armatimonadota bacterium]|nr:ATPase, T2SS/T4P/T4SS family [Armatimonadota bacterium]